MSPHNYLTFRYAVLGRRQVFCQYDGHARALCPHSVGHKGVKEAAICYQFGGDSAGGLPPGGQWLTVFISGVSNVLSKSGPWHMGDSGALPRGFLDTVDVEVGAEAQAASKTECSTRE